MAVLLLMKQKPHYYSLCGKWLHFEACTVTTCNSPCVQELERKLNPKYSSSSVLCHVTKTEVWWGLNLCCGDRTAQLKTLWNQIILHGLEGCCFGGCVISHVGQPDLNQVCHSRPTSCSLLPVSPWLSIIWKLNGAPVVPVVRFCDRSGLLEDFPG